MSDQLAQALKNLHDVLQHETHNCCVGVSVFFNNVGYEVEYMTRTPDSLQRDGISMRNLRGDWIK